MAARPITYRHAVSVAPDAVSVYPSACALDPLLLGVLSATTSARPLSPALLPAQDSNLELTVNSRPRSPFTPTGNVRFTPARCRNHYSILVSDLSSFSFVKLLGEIYLPTTRLSLVLKLAQATTPCQAFSLVFWISRFK
jgi:hypothetical protein